MGRFAPEAGHRSVNWGWGESLEVRRARPLAAAWSWHRDGRGKGKMLMNGSHSRLSVSSSALFTAVRDPAAEVGKVALPGHGCWVEKSGGETPAFPLLPRTFHSSGVLNNRKERNF